MDDGWLMAQRALLLSYEAELHGMVALNQHRLSRDETIAYDDNAFEEVRNRLIAIYHDIMENR